MVFGQEIHFSPSDKPQKTEKSRYGKSRPPSPFEINRKNNKRSDCTANGRTTVKKSRSQTAFALRKPFRNRLCRAWPVGRFSSTQQKPKDCKTAEAVRERSTNGNEGVPQHRNRKTALRSNTIDRPSADRLSERVRHAKANPNVGVIGVRPMVVLLKIRCENRKRLAVNVIDNGGCKQQTTNPPAQVANRPRAGGTGRRNHLPCGRHFRAEQRSRILVQVNRCVGMLPQDGSRKH